MLLFTHIITVHVGEYFILLHWSRRSSVSSDLKVKYMNFKQNLVHKLHQIKHASNLIKHKTRYPWTTMLIWLYNYGKLTTLSKVYTSSDRPCERFLKFQISECKWGVNLYSTTTLASAPFPVLLCGIFYSGLDNGESIRGQTLLF